MSLKTNELKWLALMLVAALMLAFAVSETTARANIDLDEDLTANMDLEPEDGAGGGCGFKSGGSKSYSKGGSSKGSTGSSFWGTAGKGTKATSGGKSGTPSKVHGNSKLSTKPQHGYEIYNTETGDVVKTGISGQKMNLNGTSPRANTQVNELNKSVGKNLYDSGIVTTDMPNRLSALEWERENALRLWNEGNSMSLHKRPRSWEE